MQKGRKETLKDNKAENQKNKETEKRNIGGETVRARRDEKSEDKDKEMERQLIKTKRKRGNGETKET